MYSYDAFAADFHDLLPRDPNACVVLGVPRRLGELPDPSRAGAEADHPVFLAAVVGRRIELMAAKEPHGFLSKSNR